MNRSALVGSLLVVVSLVACGGDDDDSSAAPTTEASDPAEQSATTAAPAEEAPVSGESDTQCGVTLAEVEELLPGSGVSENTTPDPRRCNFTWDDGGPRGIDTAIVPGGRASVDVPDGYEPLDGYGDEAYSSIARGRASAIAFVGEDLYAADVSADGGTFDDAELADLSLQLLALTLD